MKSFHCKPEHAPPKPKFKYYVITVYKNDGCLAQLDLAITKAIKRKPVLWDYMRRERRLGFGYCHLGAALDAAGRAKALRGVQAFVEKLVEVW
jgi:hypothetical protein